MTTPSAPPPSAPPPPVAVDLVLSVEVERPDKSKRLVAVIRQSTASGRTVIERADEKVKADYVRWTHHGLVELMGPEGKRTQRHTKPNDPQFLPRLREFIAKYSYIGTITQVAAPIPPKVHTFQDEIADVMDVYAAPVAAVLFMDCTPGDIIRRKAGTLHVKTGRTPCRGCMEILDMMSKREAEVWPDGRMRRKKCQQCVDWHWIYVDEHSVGVMQPAEDVEGHESCIVLYTYTGKKLRYTVAPDTCAACAESLPKLGKITSIIMGESWPVERGG